MAVVATERLKGKTVLEAGGQVVGTVDELLIDTEAWRVAGLRLRLRREVAREVGASGGLFHGAVLEVPLEMIAAARDAVILAVPLAKLRDLTGDKRTTEPAPETPASGELV